MRHPDLDRMVQYERWRDEVDQAAYSRLVKEAELARAQQAERTLSLSFSLRLLALALARLLSFLGEHMVNWSCRLQIRYTALSDVASKGQPCR